MTSTSDVVVSGTGVDPAVHASAVIREEADRLLRAYEAKAALVTELRFDGALRQQMYVRLLDFTNNRVRPYLAATDRVLYAAGAGAAETRLLVWAQRRLRESITRHIDELSAASAPENAATAAQALGVVLAACLEIDRTVLLPALAELPGVDLAGLAADLRTALDGRPEPLNVRPSRVVGRPR